MRKLWLMTIVLSMGCTDLLDDAALIPLKGNVTFAEVPAYSNGVITFKAAISYDKSGGPVDIPYSILHGNSQVLQGSSRSGINTDGGQQLFFETNVVQVSINAQTYTGQSLTIWLDPENKVTSSAFSSASQVDLWKKETVNIP